MLSLSRTYGSILYAIEALVPGFQHMTRAQLASEAPDEVFSQLLPDLEASRPTGNGGTDFKVTHLISPRYQRELHFGRRDVNNAEWRRWAKLAPR